MSNKNLTVGVKRLFDTAKLPNRAYKSDSGADLFYCHPQGEGNSISIQPFSTQVLATGLQMNIPEPFYIELFDTSNNTLDFPTFRADVLITWEIQIRSKSGMSAKRNLFVLNSPGTIDNSFKGEVKVILYNASEVTQTIEHGDKIAQAVLCPVVCCDYEDTDDIGNSDRAENGFGHTGK